MRWAVKLGHIDIRVEVSMLSSHLANLRSGHLEAAYHIIAYLKKDYKRTLAFDPRTPVIDQERFEKCDWTDFYRGAKEPILERAPKPRGKIVSIHCFVDASHANSQSNQRTQTGILIYINISPIIWSSKRQNTVETSTFGSELVALWIAVEQIQALCHKIRSSGTPIDGPADVFCNDESVTRTTRSPQDTLSKKHNAVSYHKI